MNNRCNFFPFLPNWCKFFFLQKWISRTTEAQLQMNKSCHHDTTLRRCEIEKDWTEIVPTIHFFTLKSCQRSTTLSKEVVLMWHDLLIFIKKIILHLFGKKQKKIAPFLCFCPLCHIMGVHSACLYILRAYIPTKVDEKKKKFLHNFHNHI